MMRERSRWFSFVGAWTSAGVLMLAIAAQRRSPAGWKRERDGMYSLTEKPGSNAFSTVSWVVAHVPILAVVTAALIVCAACFSSSRRGAVAAGVLMIGANGSAQLIKNALGRVLPEVADSLPSGHATLAAACACALVLICPPRWRDASLVLAAAIASLGCTGVIAAYWHVPGDVMAALACVFAWVALVRLWAAPGMSPAGRGHRADGRRRDLGLSLAGAAWAVVTLLGWGTWINAFSIWRDLAAMGELVLVPALAALLVVWTARGLPASGGATH